MEPGSLVASGALRARGACLRPLCRNFARGFCRWGQSCRFSHDRKSAHICRHFQNGFCSYGERCGYEHVREEPVPVGIRYGPVPPVPPGRRGLEPGRPPAAVARGWGGARHSSARPVPRVMRVAFKFASMEGKEEEKNKDNIPAPDNVPRGAAGGEFVPAQAQGASGSQQRGLGLDPNSPDSREAVVETVTWSNPAEVPKELGAAAAPVPIAVLRARSEVVVCGICMDRVYEKLLPEERLFGILPNCSHAYCVGCIRKWRRSRDFQSTVIKKIRCKFFVQNHGHCPFKSDCIYLHELPAGQLPQPRQQQPTVLVELSPSPLEGSDEEDEMFCAHEWALTLTLTDMTLRYLHCGQEMLFINFSNSN
ncbi:probable E3 ubiquitin-protein ligase makorin-1 isoform X2 [Tyto alba]|uniref:probable E3 ubiquitin-protein ligase makorin-1 isoform X2 n=1 Tax=Tyto alba TaxID=56313 RepID=UPI00140363D5|nr:probable E3 ubiquitin-protein ligase makorin-1 isoform X2 [Tyto alba]